MLRLQHDDQQTEAECADCGSAFRSVMGVIYEDDDPIAIYRADIFDHFHRDPEPRVLLSIAMGDWDDGTGSADRCSAAVEACAPSTTRCSTVVGGSPKRLRKAATSARETSPRTMTAMRLPRPVVPPARAGAAW